MGDIRHYQKRTQYKNFHHVEIDIPQGELLRPQSGPDYKSHKIDSKYRIYYSLQFPFLADSAINLPRAGVGGPN